MITEKLYAEQMLNSFFHLWIMVTEMRLIKFNITATNYLIPWKLWLCFQYYVWFVCVWVLFCKMKFQLLLFEICCERDGLWLCQKINVRECSVSVLTWKSGYWHHMHMWTRRKKILKKTSRKMKWEKDHKQQRKRNWEQNKIREIKWRHARTTREWHWIEYIMDDKDEVDNKQK